MPVPDIDSMSSVVPVAALLWSSSGAQRLCRRGTMAMLVTLLHPFLQVVQEHGVCLAVRGGTAGQVTCPSLGSPFAWVMAVPFCVSLVLSMCTAQLVVPGILIARGGSTASPHRIARLVAAACCGVLLGCMVSQMKVGAGDSAR